MPQVNNDEFVVKLTGLFKDAKTQGSVYLNQKRLVKDGPDSVLHSQQAPYALIFRASNGRSRRDKNGRKVLDSQRSSFTTVVEEKDLVKFWQKYAEALKKGASGLRKKEKKKKK